MADNSINNETKDNEMKNTLAKNEIMVAVWYDIVSNESAESGEYESTGNDWREYIFTDMAEAIECAEEYVGCHDSVSEVDAMQDGSNNYATIYGVDEDLDLITGDKSYNRAAIWTADYK